MPLDLKLKKVSTFNEKEISVNDIDAIFSRLDADNSGFVDYSEFIASAANSKSILTNEKLKIAFSTFDADGNGKLSANEIK